MTKKEANALMRAHYATGTPWHDRPNGRAERDALMRGENPWPQGATTPRAAPKPQKESPRRSKLQAASQTAITKPTKSDFKPGMKVAFFARGRRYEGYVIKRHPKNIRVKAGGQEWIVAPAGLTILGGEVEGYPLWSLRRKKDGGVSFYKKSILPVGKAWPAGFVGVAEATPRPGRRDIGYWPFEVYKDEKGYYATNLDFEEHRGHYPTLQAMMEAIQEDAEGTGT